VKLFTGLIVIMLSLLAAHGDAVYQCEFKPDQLQDWTIPQFAAIETLNGSQALRVSVSPENGIGKMNFVSRKFDLGQYKNKILIFSCKIKADQVTMPKHAWNGVKLMVNFRTGKQEAWKQISDVWGTFDWKDFSVSFSVPDDASNGTLLLGLQDCSGTVWFSDCRIAMFEPQSIYAKPSIPENFKAEYTSRVSDMSSLRGVMSPGKYRKGDLDDLAKWGANLIRWQLVRAWGKAGTDRDPVEYFKWIDAQIADLELVLADAGRLGIKVVIDLHSPPGGRNATRDMAMFYEEKYAKQFIETWERIARKFKGHPAVWGYDLINEPVQTMPALYDYLTIQIMAAKAIRQIDPDVPVIIESNEWDNPGAFKYLTPLPMKDVIYQVHMYIPGEFTNQGVKNNWGEKSKDNLSTYPGLIGGKEYNSEALSQALQPVIDFQKKYGVRIYVGEFSAVRWAPGAAKYLEDCISIFEEHNWDWSYHAFREWSGWSVEHGSDWNNNSPVSQDTDRKKVLLKWFEKNQKQSGSKK